LPALAAPCLLWLAACSGTSHGQPGADGVSVAPSSEVRQGQIGAVLTVQRSAGGLSRASRADLEDLTVAIDPKSTDERLLVNVTVPHGAALGPRTFTLETPSGTLTQPSAVEVTPITVGPAGDDASLGTRSAPFRSLKQALLVAGAGDTCLLQNGTYAATSGETWGYALPEPLTIEGESFAQTILEGPEQTSPGAPQAGTPALAPSADLSLAQLSLTGFDVAVAATGPAQLSLQDVVIDGKSGVVAEGDGSSLKLTGGSIDASDFAVQLGDTCSGCSLSIDSTTLTESGDGPVVQVSKAAQHSQLSLTQAQIVGGVLVLDPTATVTLSGGVLTGGGVAPGLDFAGATLEANGSAFRAASAPYGLSLRAGTISLSDATVEGNQYGVYQLGGSSKVRGSKISGYASIGIYFATGNMDLGTATEAGNNTFVGGSDNAYGIYVDTNTSPPTCSNTSFDGMVPDPGMVQAGIDLLFAPSEYVLAATKTITFFRVP